MKVFTIVSIIIFSQNLYANCHEILSFSIYSKFRDYLVNQNSNTAIIDKVSSNMCDKFQKELESLYIKDIKLFDNCPSAKLKANFKINSLNLEKAIISKHSVFKPDKCSPALMTNLIESGVLAYNSKMLEDPLSYKEGCNLIIEHLSLLYKKCSLE